MTLAVLLLGPVDVRVDDVSLPLGGPKQRALLAMLALAESRVVPVSRLVDGLWGEDVPATAENTVQVHVAGLRRALGAAGMRDRLRTAAPGYALDLTDDETDLARFRRLRREGDTARTAGRPAEAAGHYSTALGLWRGEPLADLAAEPFAPNQAVALAEQRQDVVDSLLDVQLAQGHHRDVLPVAEQLLVEYPTRETLWAQLMLALYRSGRQADALAAYDRARRHLDEELGVQPGPELRELQAKILRQDPSLAAPASRPGGALNLAVCTSTMVRADQANVVAELVTATGDRVELADETDIGRHPACTLQLADPGVSRRHVLIRTTASGHVLQDLGSTNGTKVNGLDATQHLLAHGDRIEVGATVLRYELR